MLECIKEKPNCFNHINVPTLNFRAINEDGIYMEVAVQENYTIASLHIDMKKWNHNILKELFKDWDALKSIMAHRGITKFIASNAADDDKWKRFISYFGFPEPKWILISEQEI